MKSAFKALALFIPSLLWLCAFPAVTTKGTAAGQSVVLGMFVLIAPFLLPILGFLLVRKQPRSSIYKLALFPAFIMSLLPAATILCVLSVLFFVPSPGHIYPRGTGRISVGMTTTEVYEKIGVPDKVIAPGQPGTVRYILERPFQDDRQFYVTFLNGKVISSEIKNQKPESD